MSRSILNFWLDCTLLVVFVALLFFTVVLNYVFPPATVSQGWLLWGANYNQWVYFQFLVICTFTLLLLLHIMLHWTWVCGVTAGMLAKLRGGPKKMWDNGVRTIVGVGFMIVLLNILGLMIAIAALSIQGPDL